MELEKEESRIDQMVKRIGEQLNIKKNGCPVSMIPLEQNAFIAGMMYRDLLTLEAMKGIMRAIDPRSLCIHSNDSLSIAMGACDIADHIIRIRNDEIEEEKHASEKVEQKKD